MCENCWRKWDTKETLENPQEFVHANCVKVFGLSPDGFREMLENNGFRMEVTFGKVFTMPLDLSFLKKRTAEREFLSGPRREATEHRIHMLDKPDTVSLAAHIQVVRYKL